MTNSMYISLIGEFDFLRTGSITRSKGINKRIYLNTFNIWRGSVILKSLILFLFIKSSKLGLVVRACNPFTQEAEAGGLSWVWEQPGLHIYKLSYKANLCHKHQTTKTNKSSSLIVMVSSVYWKKKEKGLHVLLPLGKLSHSLNFNSRTTLWDRRWWYTSLIPLTQQHLWGSGGGGGAQRNDWIITTLSVMSFPFSPGKPRLLLLHA